MTIFRSVKAASVFLALGVASGAGLLAQDRRAGPGDGPNPAEPARAAPADDPSVVEVKPGKLALNLIERGAVEATRVADLICEVGISTTIINIKPDGSRVAKGEVVVELDSTILRDQLGTQRVTIQGAEAALHRAILIREVAEIAVKEYADGIGPREQEDLQAKVANARAGIEKGRARLERTRLARKRFDEAAARRAGPETAADVAADLAVADRLDEAELGLRALGFDLEAAEGRRALVEKYAVAKTTRRLQADVDEARRDELAKRSAWELEESRASKLEREIGRSTLRAPGDGVLVHVDDPGLRPGRPTIEEGATVRDRQILCRVVDLDAPMRINAKVHESLVDQVQPGQAVRVKVDAMPNQVLAGVVRSVAPRADANSRFADGRKVYTTLIQIEKAVPNLRPGMTAAVDISLFELDDVLAVPYSSVVRIDDKDRVAVKAPGGTIELREVTLGRANDRAVEVKQGLRPGDRVLLDPMKGTSPKGPSPSPASR